MGDPVTHAVQTASVLACVERPADDSQRVQCSSFEARDVAACVSRKCGSISIAPVGRCTWTRFFRSRDFEERRFSANHLLCARGGARGAN